MKATGIVRRIDDLGRIVIPKEVRRILSIKAGDPLEIFVDKEGLFLRKYLTDENIEGNLDILNEIILEYEHNLGTQKTNELLKAISNMKDILKN